VSPTICLSGPRAAAQGIPATLGDEVDHLNLKFDFYSGFDDPSYSSVLFMYAVRWMGSGLPTLLQPGSPQVPAWTSFDAPGVDYAYYSPMCLVVDSGLDLDSRPPASTWPHVDSLQIALEDQTRCHRFGATACGNARGHYWDNLRVQFVRSTPFTDATPGPALDFVSGSFPNPSPDGKVAIRFTLRRPKQVTLRLYDLRGALVVEAVLEGLAGVNEFIWDGRTSWGPPAPSGVYFYRLFADGIEFRNNAQRVVLLGRGGR
jgi:hypothetical protein